MRISPVSFSNYMPHSQILESAPPPNSSLNNTNYHLATTPVVFTAEPQRHRKIQDIDFHTYNHLSENMKKLYRKKCENFSKTVNVGELANPRLNYLPLMSDCIMENFLDVCRMYNKLKGTPIICLGRSPKWFLNTAMWMKDGIDNYTFVAFSESWYAFNRYKWGKYETQAPNSEEKNAYKSYLKTMKATPQDIIEQCQKTGKKVVITDYISSGKGVTSFLDILSEIAEDDGVLDEFANSIRILGIGCMDYQENFYYEDESISIPEVQMPERLRPYKNIIKQEFHDMPRAMFDEMLLNQNTNECRSSYYPHWVWTIYKPYQFKTGKISEEKAKAIMNNKSSKSLTNFTPAMKDYRNLLNFRILDYLAQNGLLRDKLPTKQTD